MFYTQILVRLSICLLVCQFASHTQTQAAAALSDSEYDTTKCGGYIKLNLGNRETYYDFGSQLMGSSYFPNENCIWLFELEGDKNDISEYRLRIVLPRINLVTDSDGRCLDYIEAKDGTQYTDRMLLNKTCQLGSGQAWELVGIMSHGRHIWFHFYSGSQGNQVGGFKAAIHVSKYDENIQSQYLVETFFDTCHGFLCQNKMCLEDLEPNKPKCDSCYTDCGDFSEMNPCSQLPDECMRRRPRPTVSTTVVRTAPPPPVLTLTLTLTESSLTPSGSTKENSPSPPLPSFHSPSTIRTTVTVREASNTDKGSTNKNSRDDGSTNETLLIFIVVGVLLFLIALMTFVICVYCYKRRTLSKADAYPTEHNARGTAHRSSNQAFETADIESYEVTAVTRPFSGQSGKALRGKLQGLPHYSGPTPAPDTTYCDVELAASGGQEGVVCGRQDPDINKDSSGSSKSSSSNVSSGPGVANNYEDRQRHTTSNVYIGSD